DVTWSYAFTGLAWFYAVTGPGWLPRRLIIASLATVWSCRLGTHLLRRIRRHHPEEDSRYRALREEWSAGFTSKMALFFQAQALSVITLGLPFLLPTRNAFPGLGAAELAGIFICIVGILGESRADQQLAAFRAQSSNHGKVCNVGLWRYSRHPNYFFEWCIWVGFSVFALHSAWGWIALSAPAIMLHLLRNVTGVPMAEESSLRSKGDAFRAYQQTTNTFFPGPPRES